MTDPPRLVSRDREGGLADPHVCFPRNGAGSGDALRGASHWTPSGTWGSVGKTAICVQCVSPRGTDRVTSSPPEDVPVI